MTTLPLYIIEKVGNLWTVYNTDTCEQWQFETRTEAENYLKKLN